MSEAKEFNGTVDAVSKNDKGIGLRFGDFWFNSTVKTREDMEQVQKGERVRFRYLESEVNGRKYRNIITFAFMDPAEEMEPTDMTNETSQESAGEQPPVPAAKPAIKTAAKASEKAPKNGLDLAREKKLTIQLQGKEYINHAGLLIIAHELGLEQIQTELVHYDMEKKTAIVKASVSMKDDGFFQGLGDVTPKNVNSMIAEHFIRMAETRAVSRALRLATGVGLTALEELGGSNETQAPAAKEKDVVQVGEVKVTEENFEGQK